MTQRILLLATVTLFGFPLIGWVILWAFNGPSFFTIFNANYPLLMQVMLGVITGSIAGVSAWLIIQSRFMAEVREKYGSIIGAFRLNPLQIGYVSLCAGIGEEILFRGVIQHYLGIWITAVFFVAIHGYLNPKQLKLFAYGAFMTLFIALIGYLTEVIGIVTAITAHTVIDIILLWQMSKVPANETHPLQDSFTGRNEQ